MRVRVRVKVVKAVKLVKMKKAKVRVKARMRRHLSDHDSGDRDAAWTSLVRDELVSHHLLNELARFRRTTLTSE